jgi:hypothetical protein
VVIAVFLTPLKPFAVDHRDSQCFTVATFCIRPSHHRFPATADFWRMTGYTEVI